MKKGIIMEVNEKYLTMLTPDGEFLRARNTNSQYEIGQEIDFFPIKLDARKKKTLFTFLQSFKGRSIAAVGLACMLLIFSFIPFNNNDVYAYMSIDINPSFEMGVNEDLKVIELIPYNESAKKIISEINAWEKQDIGAVTEKILARVKENGFLNEQNNVVIGTVHIGERVKEVDQKLQDTVNTITHEIKEEKDKVIIKAIEATTQERVAAKESGVTVGKYKDQQQEKKKADKVKKEELNTPTNNKEKNKGQSSKNESNNMGNSNKQKDNKEKNNNRNVKEDKGNNKKEDKLKEQNNKRVPPGQQKKNQQENGNQHNENKNKKDDEKGKKDRGEREDREERENRKGKDKDEEDDRDDDKEGRDGDRDKDRD